MIRSLCSAWAIVVLLLNLLRRYAAARSFAVYPSRNGGAPARPSARRGGAAPEADGPLLIRRLLLWRSELRLHQRHKRLERGGEHVTVWRASAGVIVLDAPAALRWVHALRMDEATQQIHLLTDPWGEHPAVWELRPLTLTVQKVRDFLDYQERAYVDEVNW